MEPREYKALVTVFQATRLAVRPMTLALHEESLFRSAVRRHLGLFSQSPLLEFCGTAVSLVDLTFPRHIFCHFLFYNFSSRTTLNNYCELSLSQRIFRFIIHSHFALLFYTSEVAVFGRRSIFERGALIVKLEYKQWRTQLSLFRYNRPLWLKQTRGQLCRRVEVEEEDRDLGEHETETVEVRRTMERLWIEM